MGTAQKTAFSVLGIAIAVAIILLVGTPFIMLAFSYGGM